MVMMMMSQSHPQNSNNNNNNNNNHQNNHHYQQPSPISLSPLSSVTPPPSAHHAVPISAFQAEVLPTRVRLSDIAPYDGAPCGAYLKAVEALCGSLMRHNAAVIELGSGDAAVMRCGLESARLYFRNKAKGTRGVYMYRAGRCRALQTIGKMLLIVGVRLPMKGGRGTLELLFEGLWKIVIHLLHAWLKYLDAWVRLLVLFCVLLRSIFVCVVSIVFNHLLDDNPLPANEASSSVVVATYSHTSMQNGKGAIGGGKPSASGESEKGLLTLVSCDTPGIQVSDLSPDSSMLSFRVCDPNGRWYLADSGFGSGSVLLLTGKALSHATAGLRPAASYRAVSNFSSGVGRLMPQSNAILDCSPITAAGHVIPHSYVPISVSQFMDDLSAEEDALCNQADSIYVEQNNNNKKEPSLRSVLSDPLSGVFLEDAMVVSCGHSFGGLMLRKVIEAVGQPFA
ncbi:U-box domain-containing protein 63 [Bienertia sinuspersici]